MIRNSWNDKKADIQGLKKQTSSLLNCAWEKGYVAGFDDGYKSGRQAEKRPKGEWLPKGRWHIDPQCIEYTCSICGRRIMREERLNVIEQYPFCHCGADMRGDV